MATVRYFVDDVEAATRFYTERLGFAVAERFGAALTIVERGDLQLLLSGPQTSAARPMPDGRKPEPGGWNRLVIEVADLAALMQSLRDTGVRFRSDLVSGPGGRQALAEDPAGIQSSSSSRRHGRRVGSPPEGAGKLLSYDLAAHWR